MYSPFIFASNQTRDSRK